MTRRPYVRPMSNTSWFLRQPRYRAYMLREATCLLVAVYTALLLSLLAALAADDPVRWADWLAAQQHPAWIVFHALANHPHVRLGVFLVTGCCRICDHESRRSVSIFIQPTRLLSMMPCAAQLTATRSIQVPSTL